MGGETDVIATLLSSGPVGVVLVAILLGYIVPKPTVTQMQATIDRLIGERNDAQERERQAMNQVADKVIPLMTKAIDVLEDQERGRRVGEGQ